MSYICSIILNANDAHLRLISLLFNGTYVDILFRRIKLTTLFFKIATHTLCACSRLVLFLSIMNERVVWMQCAWNRCQPVRESFALPISTLTLLPARQVDRPVHRWSYIQDGTLRRAVQFQGNTRWNYATSLNQLNSDTYEFRYH